MDNIKKPDPAHEAEIVKEADEDKKTAETVALSMKKSGRTPQSPTAILPPLMSCSQTAQNC